MLLDTSGLLSLFDRGAAVHPEAVRLYHAAPRLIVHNYVLAEFVPLAHVRRMPRRQSLDYLVSLLGHPRVEMTWADGALHQSAMDLLAQRMDKTYSLCDAVSFVLMRRHGVQSALTTDHHFGQEGFVRLLR